MAEDRSYIWWRCKNLLECPTKEKDSHIPILKSYLLALRTTAEEAVREFRTNTSSEFPMCETHLRNIFSDRDAFTTTVTSLNIKSLQCSILFTLMDPGGIRSFEDSDKMFARILATPTWDTFRGMLELLASLRTFRTDPYDLVIESELASGESLCGPKLEHKALVLLTGNMTLYEILRSMADNIYIVGLSSTSGFADGIYMDPFTFLIHDLAHRRYRLTYFGTTPTTNSNIRRVLDAVQTSGLSESVIAACHLWIFLLIHEPTFPLKQEEFFLSGPITKDKLDYVVTLRVSPTWAGGQTLDIYTFLVHSFGNMNDRGGLLPLELQEEMKAGRPVESSIKGYLEHTWNIFVEVWNMFVLSSAASPPAAGDFGARLVKNVSNWNSRRKMRRNRTKRRRSRRSL